MQKKYKKLIESYALCIDEKRYYDAHEALEEIWYPRRFEDNNEMRLLKGFINASVSFELIQRGRKKPAKQVWLTYLKYRQLLYKVHSPHLRDYHNLARKIEHIYHTQTI